MTRSPLAYPLNRSADMDAGGAADLQTDIMRFMAILSLCLVAIFALVQSIPITPTQPVQAESQAPAAVAAKKLIPPPDLPKPVAPTPVKTPAEKAVTLTRPKWVPKVCAQGKGRETGGTDLPMYRHLLRHCRAHRRQLHHLSRAKQKDLRFDSSQTRRSRGLSQPAISDFTHWKMTAPSA